MRTRRCTLFAFDTVLRISPDTRGIRRYPTGHPIECVRLTESFIDNWYYGYWYCTPRHAVCSVSYDVDDRRRRDVYMYCTVACTASENEVEPMDDLTSISFQYTDPTPLLRERTFFPLFVSHQGRGGVSARVPDPHPQTANEKQNAKQYCLSTDYQYDICV
jgi:hypothetical protein